MTLLALIVIACFGLLAARALQPAPVRQPVRVAARRRH